MDVDGTLTDGKLYIGESGEIMKAFNIKDGLGIKQLLSKQGIIPVVVTGRQSQIVLNRCREIGIQEIYQGVTDKLAFLKSYIDRKKIKINTILYMGDDINDEETMKYLKENGGICACPFDAASSLIDICDITASRKGGEGAVREIIDKIILGDDRNEPFYK